MALSFGFVAACCFYVGYVYRREGAPRWWALLVVGAMCAGLSIAALVTRGV